MQNEISPTGGAQANKSARQTLPKYFSSRLPDSFWFDLLLSFLLGLLFALHLLGPRVLDPTNITWLHGDPAAYYAGWAFLRQDRHFHWPLTYTDRLGFPIGISVSLIDVNPALAILFKIFSFLLPEHFQYLGLEAVLACTLQVFFSMRLFRLLLGVKAFDVIAPALFFLIAPPLTFRLGGHFALSNQWLLCAALLIFFLANQHEPITTRRFLAMSLSLAAISTGINPYLAFEVLVLLSVTVITLIWRRRLTLVRGTMAMAGLAIVSAAAAYIFGFIIPGGQGYDGPGYRLYSLNLLSPFNPEGYGSLLLRPLPEFSPAQAEGYNYLGAGVILLAVVLLFILPLRWSKIRSLQWRFAVPLFLGCAALSLMALSTQVTLGSRLLADLDPHQVLTPYLAALRSSGRLFWAPYYAFLAVLFILLYRVCSRPWASALIAIAFAIQIADLAPLEHSVHAAVNEPFQTPLTSPVWTSLGSSYKDLIVLPPWQCDPDGSPGGSNGAEMFDALALAQRMRTNDFYAARYTSTDQRYFCQTSLSNMTEHRLSSASVYVVTRDLANEIASAGTGQCYSSNGFILCSARKDPSLGRPYEVSYPLPWIASRFAIILGREPTQQEQAEWLAKLKGGTPAYVEFLQALLGSAEFENKTLPRFSEFCSSQGRCPTFSDWNSRGSWIPHVSGVNRQKESIARDRDRATVTALYFSVFQRDPDSPGVEGWTTALKHESLKNVIAGLLNSEEYASRLELHYP